MRAIVFLVALTLLCAAVVMAGNASAQPSHAKAISFEIRYLDQVQSVGDRNARYQMNISQSSSGEVYSFVDTKTGKTLKSLSALIRSSPVVLTGKDIALAVAKDDRRYGPEIDINLKPDGGRKFARFTTLHEHEIFAVVIDGKIVTAPVIESPITGGALEISGAIKTLEQAQKIAAQLNAH